MVGIQGPFRAAPLSGPPAFFGLIACTTWPQRDAIKAADEARGKDGADPAQLRLTVAESLLWGLRCVARALHFLHDSCSLVHAALAPQALFVTEVSADGMACPARM